MNIQPLPTDLIRCYGEDCDQKLECLRYMTMRVDEKAVYSYALSMIPDCGECEYFIPNPKDML